MVDGAAPAFFREGHMTLADAVRIAEALGRDRHDLQRLRWILAGVPLRQCDPKALRRMRDGALMAVAMLVADDELYHETRNLICQMTDHLAAIEPRPWPDGRGKDATDQGPV